MEKKNNLTKNIFLLFFAFCFLSVGLLAINKGQPENYTLAEDVSSEDIDNQNIPSYFSAKEFFGEDENTSSLIEDETFLFFREGGVSNHLSLSLTQNGHLEGANDIYSYVYYPDTENRSYFNFFSIGSISLYVNGENQNINMGDFVNSSGMAFQNKDSAQLEGFEMVFNEHGNQPNLKQNVIKITDENNQIIEGVYTLSLTLTVYTCTDGKNDASEDSSAFSDTNVTINYSFYVLDRETYFLNNRPNVSRVAFDHEVPVSTMTSQNYAYYLYSNYSAKNQANKMPYIEFDYTRYELAVSKELSNSVSSATIQYDKDENLPILKGNNIVHTKTDPTNKKCKVFFKDVGDYNVTLNAIKIVEYQIDQTTTQQRKYNLSGVTSITKRILVYMYGYQATYTDFDKPVDENKIRPTTELKEYDYANEVFKNGADITSGFINSNDNYSQDSGNTTFLIQNVLSYIDNKNNPVTAVKTNQTPIKLDANANLSTAVNSYIFSTEKVSDAYSETNQKLNGQTLYRAKFNGRTDSTAGKYIYLLAYTFKNFYTTETTLAANKVFYQVFYFEIVKELPSIQITSEGQNVSSDTFINKDVVITDSTKNEPFNRDVTIQIYAYDYSTKNFMDSFGGTRGISFNNLLPADANDNQITLTNNAFYTIRLYYTNEITNENILYSSNRGFFREQTFTIDKTPIENITGRNVIEVTSSTDYKIISTMSTFSTNQDMVLSWNEKQSGAKTFAYYRYFPIVEEQYYSKREATLSATIQRMLNYTLNTSYLPVNNILNLSTDNNNWLPYKGNTFEIETNGNVSTEYVFSDAGLYLVDVYDEAGNHTVEVFMIDNTKPVFAIYDDISYTLTNSSLYVTKPSTLFWANYKAIYIANFNTIPYNSSYNPSNITEENLKPYQFYTTHDKKTSTDIFKVLYNRLFAQNFMQVLNCNVSISSSVDGTSNMIKGYSGLYITIPINAVSYFIDRDHKSYTYQTGVYKQSIKVEEEMTYRILIRDMSNTKYDLNYGQDATIQYTNFYSARQTILISFDDSEFFIQYTNSDNEIESLESNNIVEGIYNDDTTKKTKLTYLSPTSLNKPFTLSFLPTKIDGDLSIQVDKVKIKYFPYIEQTTQIGNVYYHYLELSNNATEITVYDYSENRSMTTLKQDEIRLNADNVTTAGKYEISRTYYTQEGYSYNENDYFERTYVFYVDRNEVVTNAELVNNENGSHLESLVGGDVFISMYDNKQNSSLVVTFPNSPEGNTEGSSIYNNGTIRSILTTNKLPVYVYIPQMKYTKYVQKNEKTDGYDFSVETNDPMNNYSENNLIEEYALFAELYKNGTSQQNLIASTTTNRNNPNLETVVVDENGFLIFFDNSGSKLNYLKDAGTYYVKLYQGRFGTGIGDNNYQQSLTFAFDIKKSSPDFEAQSITGATLHADKVVVSDPTRPSTIYYTNQSNVNLIWDEGSAYMAEIDMEEISFVTSKGTRFKATDDVFAEKPVVSNHTYIAQLSLEKLNIYENDAYVDITMQFKNHNDEFYAKVVKRIFVDLSAPSNNVQTLVENSIQSSMIVPLKNTALRTYYTAKMQQTDDLSKTSYNISTNTGTFAYYSYTTTEAYLQTLKNTVDTSNIYVREFADMAGNNTKYTSSDQQETSPADFLPSNFDTINAISQLKANTYYEIVEMDKAGNMSIYTVYIKSYQSTQTENDNLISYVDAEGTKKSYTIEDYLKTLSYANATHNIYSKTGFQLQNINFFGDAWTQIQLNTLNPNGFATTRYLMLTPWDKDYAYAYVGNNYTKILITDLIDGLTSSRYKNSLNIYNRENKTYSNFFINIRNTNLNSSLTDDINREFIQFNKPTDQAIQNATYSSTYLTYLRIKANDEIIFDQQNSLGFAGLWNSNANINVVLNETLGTIIFELRPELGFVADTRISYEFTDNYGSNYKEIHLYKETIITKEISSQQDLYSYYDTAKGRLYYITKDGFQYSFNPSKYSISVFDLVDGLQSDSCTKASYSVNQDSRGISIITVKTTNDTGFYNDSFAMEVRDFNDANNLVKTIYFTLYNQLPKKNENKENNQPGQFKILDANGNNITKNIIEDINDDETGYFSEIRILYSQQETFIPVKYSISTDKITWTEISSGTRLRCQSLDMEKYYLKIWYDEKYLTNEMGTPQYVFGYVPENQIYEFNLSSLTATFWLEKTVNGVTTTVEKSDTIYRTSTGMQYSNHYIVNLDYSDRDSVKIKTNKEQEIKATLNRTYQDSSTVSSEHWIISNIENPNLGNIPAFNTNIIITYIPSTDNFVEEFYASNINGILNKDENLVTLSAKTVVIPENLQINQLKLQWSKHYGIAQNEINVRLYKDGIQLAPVVYTARENNKEYNYIYLTHSGKYTISLYDNSGNIQKFNRGNTGQTEALTFVFLKDVPFTVTYTNPETNQLETLNPIKHAVYNGTVTLNIDKSTRPEYYSLDGYPVINVKKNGEDYTGTFKDDATYIFAEPGYYEVSFTATSNQPEIGKLRQETYQFTILDPYEYRYSYIYNKYSNYYVEKVLKDNIDITENLVRMLDVETIKVNGKEYLKELPLSSTDEKTGAGVYLITINSNDTLYNQSTAKSNYTYQVTIQVGTAPIKISLKEGQETTGKITATFNQENIFNDIGKCTFRIMKNAESGNTTYYSLDIDENSTGEISTEITVSGTYYIQFVSPSGNLLYSYKVTKNDPLNAAAIIAIVISAIVAIAVVFIIIKLRKRISVK